MSRPRGFLSLAAPPPNWTDLIELAGVKAKYDPDTGMVTFEGGSFKPDDQWALWFQQRAAMSDVQQEAYTYRADTGVADAYAVVLSPLPIIVAGSEVVFLAANANTGPSTLQVNRETPVALTKNGGTVALAAGDIAAGQIVTAKYDGTVWQVTVGSVGIGSGTVTSVALTVPTGLTVAGSPITVSGTLAISEDTQAANKVKAGPATGAAAVPTYRSLVAADIPVLLTLQTDGTPNGLQSLLNLIAGTNITLTDDGVGGVTIDATGGGGGATYLKETPAGTLDGVNTVFTLSNTPTADSLTLFVNILQAEGTDYTLSGATITFTVAPEAADAGWFIAQYTF